MTDNKLVGISPSLFLGGADAEQQFIAGVVDQLDSESCGISRTKPIEIPGMRENLTDLNRDIGTRPPGLPRDAFASHDRSLKARQFPEQPIHASTLSAVPFACDRLPQ